MAANATAWIALAFSAVSVFVTVLVWWTGREKLRLELYNRRFDIYGRALDFYQALLGWEPSLFETEATSLHDSPELFAVQKAFIKASREAQFLFDDYSGIQKELEQMHAASIGIIGFKRDLAPKSVGRPEFRSLYEKAAEYWKQLHDAIPSLERRMSKYLDFHTLSAWRWGRKV